MGKRQKIQVPNGNWTHDLPKTTWTLYPLSYENLWRARPFNWVHVWHVGGAVAEWLVLWTPDRFVRVRASARALRCVLRPDTLHSQCLSSPRCINGYQRIYCWEVTLRWTSIPSRPDGPIGSHHRLYFTYYVWHASCILQGSAMPKSLWI